MLSPTARGSVLFSPYLESGMLSQLRNGLDMVYVEQNTLERVRGEHVWHGPAMLARRDDWTHALPDEAIAELDAAVLRVASERISLLDINRNTFDMPVLRDWLKPIRPPPFWVMTPRMWRYSVQGQTLPKRGWKTCAFVTRLQNHYPSIQPSI